MTNTPSAVTVHVHLCLYVKYFISCVFEIKKEKYFDKFDLVGQKMLCPLYHIRKSTKCFF